MAQQALTEAPRQGGGRAQALVPFTRDELRRLAGMYGAIALMHALGWGFFLANQHRFGVAYAGAGALAYTFGLRHAFDADHISAVDDTTRYLMQRGQRPLGVGFFFSLGHSSVVAALAVGLGLAARFVQQHIQAWHTIGATVGASVSATFLFLIGILDLVILVGLIDVWRKARTGAYRREQLDELMLQRGFLNRVLGGRWRRFIGSSWHLYPVGLLFGLGFDTASEVALLAVTAAAATTTAAGGHLPFTAIVALPLLFTAGMSLMDTTDGVLMTRAYGWAFTSPVRKLWYNLTTVALGVFVAIGVGTVEYLQVLAEHTGLHGGIWDAIGKLDFELLGYAIVGTFVLLWVGSAVIYKAGRIEERYGAAVSPPGDRAD